MTRDQAGELLALLQAAHPRTKIEDATVDLWLGELRKLDHKIGEIAVRSLVDSVKGWPSVAHLKEAAAIAREQARRVQRDEERRKAERVLDELPRIPLREIPGAVEILEWIAESPLPLEHADDGVCDDGCGRSGVRYRLGRFRLCAACARRRLNAAATSGRAA
jgi:hypothetical protein